MYKIYKKDGISFIEIKTKYFVVTLCDFAASIYSIYFNNQLMTQTIKNEKDFLNNDIYHGKTIGRSANRIKGNVILINNKEYKLQNNEGNNTLHGGKDGLSTKFFSYEIKENKDFCEVTFSYLSKDGESGFPGNLLIKVIYRIDNQEIKCMFDGISDKDTICNLTNHTFFTLGEPSLDNFYLKINSSSYLLASKDELLPIEKRSIFEELNFKDFKKINKDISSPLINMGKARGYDHSFYLDEANSMNPQIFMKNDKILLSITTDFECCQIYSDNYETKYEWINVSKDSIRRSLAIEPQDDFLNRKILKANKKYLRFITYKFTEI